MRPGLSLNSGESRRDKNKWSPLSAHPYTAPKRKVLVTLSCPTLCDPMDSSPPGSSVYGILQARILEWVAIPFSRGLPGPGIEPGSPTLQADSLLSAAPQVTVWNREDPASSQVHSDALRVIDRHIQGALEGPIKVCCVGLAFPYSPGSYRKISEATPLAGSKYRDPR